jgi:hypothetical protein
MIQAMDLKIGNWIMDDNSLYCKVIGFKPFGHSVRCDEQEGCEILVDIYRNDGTISKGYVCDSNEANPIPLSPSVLEAWGFELQPQRQSIWIKGRLKIWVGHNGCIAYVFEDKEGHSVYIGDIKYLHQLQNIFYWNNGGTELTYTKKN